MRLPMFEFIHRFLIHVPRLGLHRIRHTGFLANGIGRDRIDAIRRLIDTERKPDRTTGEDGSADADVQDPRQACSRCGNAKRSSRPSPVARSRSPAAMGGCHMIYPTHPALQSRGAGPVSTANPSALRCDGLIAAEARSDRRRRTGKIDGPARIGVSGSADRPIDCSRPEQQSP